MNVRQFTHLLPLRTTAVAFALFAALGNAHADLDLAQTPAATAFKGIAPNIVFMLDDSGSMQFEYLGNNVPSQYGYGFPPGSSYTYGSAPYSSNSYGNSPSFSSNDSTAAEYRSAYVNPNYYNPAVTYTPWACAGPYPESSSDSASLYTATGYAGTGSCYWDSNAQLWLMPQATPNSAMLNPSVSGLVRSLDVWNNSTSSNNKTANNGYSSNLSTYFGNISNCNGITGCSKNSGTVSGFWPATYFNYFGTMPGTSSTYSDLSNYQYVQICPPSSSPTTNSSSISSSATVTISSGSTGGGGGPGPGGHSSGGSSTTSSVALCTPPSTLPSSPLPYHTYLDSSGNYVYVDGDGDQTVRSYTAEMQNFANWFQYYRSHVLTARAGASQAFMKLGEGFRVSYALLNSMANGGSPYDGGSTNLFDDSSSSTVGSRSNFLADLFNTPIPAQGTPSRPAVQNIGKWFQAKPVTGQAPWGMTSEEQSDSANAGLTYLTCRQNYLVFVTDGAWNGATASSTVINADSDSVKGQTYTNEDGNTPYVYNPLPEFDNYDNSSLGKYSLANVAMYFWVNDLQTGMTNDVPTNSADPAFWQHLDTFTVGLGVNGTLTSNDWAGIQAGTVQWPTTKCWSGSGCDGSEPEQIDDLWHAAVDGHGDYFSATDPSTFATGLADTLVSISNRSQSSSSAAVNTETAGSVMTDTQVYFATFHPDGWWGEVTAYPLGHDSAGNLIIGSDANWDASCVLTGGACSAMGTNSSGSTITVTKQATRTIESWNGTQGVDFAWTSTPSSSTLTATQLASLGSQKVVDYLSGSTANEQSQTNGTLRTRDSILGDIVDSSPVWVGGPYQTKYASTWKDKLYPTTTQPENSATTDYAAFMTANESRVNAVYVGSNDGMLHAFSAGSYDSSGNYVSSTNTGAELFAYVPAGVIGNLKQYSDPSYTHHFFVDATPTTADLYYGGQWHTWLAGGLGAGGQSIYLLDITNPAQFSAQKVVGEIDSAYLAANPCVNAPTCSQSLGYTFGTPQILRFHNGQWGVVFGGGYNSATQHAVVFIALITSSGGIGDIYMLDTGAGSSTSPDGIAYVTKADLDGDNIVDYLYAGDLQGNVWRFDVTSNNPSDWKVSTYGKGTPTPLYSAVNANGTAQPITTKVLAVSVPAVGGTQPRVLIAFGTGKDIEVSDQTPNTTASGVQSMYGIWDWNMSTWDANSSTTYASLTTAPQPLTRSNLQQQYIIASTDASGNTYTGSGTGYRTTTQTTVCWTGSTTCSGGTSANTKYGWFMDLTNSKGTTDYTGEEVIYNPVFSVGAIQVNTTILSDSAGLTCTSQPTIGWTMAFDPATGGSFEESFYANANNEFNYKINDGIVAGISTGASGSATVVADGSKYYDINKNGSDDSGTVTQINPNLSATAGRLTWVELR